MWLYSLSFTIILFVYSVDGGSDWCSTTSLVKQGNMSSSIDIRVNNTYSANMSSIGAIVSAWSGPLLDQFACQLKSQREYCEKHGCKYYFLEDFSDWEQKRNGSAPHFIKIQAMMYVMNIVPRHPWVLYLDTDAAFNEKLATKTIDQLVSERDNRTWLFHPDQTHGWSSDFILVYNDAEAMNFLDHIFKYSDICPFCVGEQCAVILSLTDYIVSLYVKNLPGSGDDETIIVKRDNQLNCCNPKWFCEYPFGKARQHNTRHTANVQGCSWNWLEAVKFNDMKETQRRYSEVSHSSDLRRILGIKHPLKTVAACESFLNMTSWSLRAT